MLEGDSIMRYIHNEREENLLIDKTDILEVINEENIDDNIYQDLCKNIEDLLDNYESAEFRTKYPQYKDIPKEEYEKLLKKCTEKIRNDILSKYLLSENLHVLMSNGCSMYAGSKAINVEGECADDKKLLREFKFKKIKNKKLESLINNLDSERPEIALDILYEIKSYFENILKHKKACTEISEFISKYKEAFLKNYVFTIDYSKNEYHNRLLKRLLSRSSKLNKINIFTLNYDVLIEKTAEDMGIVVNNGFTGFHNRIFNPSSFHLDVHYNNSEGAKSYSNSINLFKLHGSLTWKLDDEKPPYGITEIQIQKVNDEKIIPDCIIYPIQTKKKHSLDLPYSEMFRQFIEFINKPGSTLLVMGYSFLDEHVNDIIANALSNPSFNLIVFSFLEESELDEDSYLKKLFKSSKTDPRITILSGKILGNFEYITKVLMPPEKEDYFEKRMNETRKNLMTGRNNV